MNCKTYNCITNYDSNPVKTKKMVSFCTILGPDTLYISLIKDKFFSTTDVRLSVSLNFKRKLLNKL